MQDVHGGVSRMKGLARNVPFQFGDITIYMQLHVQERAPFEILLGRPFEVITSAGIQNHPNGDQELTIKCPNTGKRQTMGTYPRGVRPRSNKPGKNRYSQPRLVEQGEPPHAEDGDSNVPAFPTFPPSKI